MCEHVCKLDVFNNIPKKEARYYRVKAEARAVCARARLREQVPNKQIPLKLTIK